MTRMGSCPDCGTELTPYRSSRQSQPGRAAWCWKCERVLRPGETRRARLKAERDDASEELCEKCGEPIYSRPLPGVRMCPVHARAHLASLPPLVCTPADLIETGDEGHLGLLTVLVNAGWRIYAPIGGRGSVLYAASDSYVRGETGTTEKDAALKLFSALYSDEPDAIACAAAFWPPPPPVVRVGGVA